MVSNDPASWQLWRGARIWRQGKAPADAMLTQGERIVGLGWEDEMRALLPADAGELPATDLKGAWVYPGFRDPHAHLLYLGLATYEADLSACESPEQVLETLQAFAAGQSTAGSNAWLVGRGWNDTKWPERAHLSCAMLDAVFPERPVYLVRVDHHAALVNSAALRLASITRAHPVEGGLISTRHSREQGRPDGLLVDAAMHLVSRHIPAPGPEQELEALRRAEALCFAGGLVGVADMGLSKRHYEVLLDGQREGVLRMPVYGTLTPEPETEAHYRREGPYLGDRLTLRAFKCFADGALGSRGARLLEPYSDAPETRGLWMHPPEYLNAQARLNAAQGFQTVTHAIGDAAVRQVLDAAQQAAPPPDHRWRVEHAQIVHPRDLPRFAGLGVWASIQACHGVSDRRMAPLRLGAERMEHAYRGRSLLDAGARLVNGTDFPIEPLSPLRSFAAACLRREWAALRNASRLEQPPFRPEEALSREEALLAMTAWTAEAQFQEGECGRLEPGFFADFTALDTDLMESSPEDLGRARVLRTVVRGQEVFAQHAS
jgi:predicted amidohydrolase YtcJ